MILEYFAYNLFFPPGEVQQKKWTTAMAENRKGGRREKGVWAFALPAGFV